MVQASYSTGKSSAYARQKKAVSKAKAAYAAKQKTKSTPSKSSSSRSSSSSSKSSNVFTGVTQPQSIAPPKAPVAQRQSIAPSLIPKVFTGVTQPQSIAPTKSSSSSSSKSSSQRQSIAPSLIPKVFTGVSQPQSVAKKTSDVKYGRYTEKKKELPLVFGAGTYLMADTKKANKLSLAYARAKKADPAFAARQKRAETTVQAVQDRNQNALNKMGLSQKESDNYIKELGKSTLRTILTIPTNAISMGATTLAQIETIWKTRKDFFKKDVLKKVGVATGKDIIKMVDVRDPTTAGQLLVLAGTIALSTAKIKSSSTNNVKIGLKPSGKNVIVKKTGFLKVKTKTGYKNLPFKQKIMVKLNKLSPAHLSRKAIYLSKKAVTKVKSIPRKAISKVKNIPKKASALKRKVYLSSVKKSALLRKVLKVDRLGRPRVDKPFAYLKNNLGSKEFIKTFKSQKTKVNRFAIKDPSGGTRYVSKQFMKKFRKEIIKTEGKTDYATAYKKYVSDAIKEANLLRTKALKRPTTKAWKLEKKWDIKRIIKVIDGEPIYKSTKVDYYTWKKYLKGIRKFEGTKKIGNLRKWDAATKRVERLENLKAQLKGKTSKQAVILKNRYAKAVKQNLKAIESKGKLPEQRQIQILKKPKSKAITKKPVSKSKSVTKQVTKSKVVIRKIKLSNLIPNAATILLARLIITPVPINVSDVKGATLVKTIQKPKQSVIPKQDVVPKTEVVPKQKVVPETVVESKTEPIIKNFFIPALAAAPILASVLINKFIPFRGGLPFSLPSGKGGIFAIPGSRLPKNINYAYTADLYSRVWGVRASAKERTKLLRKGRIFTGLETRKLIR